MASSDRVEMKRPTFYVTVEKVINKTLTVDPYYVLWLADKSCAEVEDFNWYPYAMKIMWSSDEANVVSHASVLKNILYVGGCDVIIGSIG